MTREEALNKIFASQSGKKIGGYTDIPANTFLDYLEVLGLIKFEEEKKAIDLHSIKMKYLAPNSYVPIDAKTTGDLVNILRMLVDEVENCNDLIGYKVIIQLSHHNIGSMPTSKVVITGKLMSISKFNFTP